MAIPRFWRVVISFFLIIVLMLSLCFQTYAVVLTATFGLVLVVSAVLVASGILMYDPVAFEDLCTRVADRLVEFDRNVKMTIFEGITFIPKALVEAIILAANDLKAFDASVDDSAVSYNAVVESMVASGYSGKWVTIDGFSYPTRDSYSFTVEPISSVHVWFNYRASADWTVPFSKTYGAFTYDFTKKDYATMSVNILGRQHIFGNFYPSSNYFKAYSIPYAQVFSPNEIWLHFPRLGSVWSSGIYQLHLNEDEIGGVSISDTPSICAELPWGKTDSLPSVNVGTGAVALPGTWVGQRDIAGVPSIPLSIPYDTPGKVGTISQPDAQSGTKTNTEVIADSAVKDFVDKGKLNITLLSFFPFCIPFDLIKAVQLLAAPAKNPVFDVPIKLPYVGVQRIHIDLTQYAGLAVFSRWFLTLAFVVGLAVGTSKVMKW